MNRTDFDTHYQQQVFPLEIPLGCDFTADGPNTYPTFNYLDQPADPVRGLKQAIEANQFEMIILAGRQTNLGNMFNGRDTFLAELRQHRTAEGPVVIKGKRTIHGMGGVGKTRATIEYAEDYRALLLISGGSPEALRNLAALCGPLVLNFPEPDEKEQALQVEAALRWLKLHPGWFLIIDNVDTDKAAEGNQSSLRQTHCWHLPGTFCFTNSGKKKIPSKSQCLEISDHDSPLT